MARIRMHDAQQSSPPGDHQRIVAALSDPRTYADRPAEVTVIETHISWVFLTNRHAYKLKKPVRFSFLDFSTPERRRAACQSELQLNRRLAPDVYLEVLPVTISNRGRVRLDGDDAPVDWVVKMRRLPADRTLEQRIRDGTLTVAEVDETAHRLADFYRCLPPLSIRTEQYHQYIEQHVLGNRHDLLDPACGLRAARVRRVHAAQLRVLRLQQAMFDDRVCDGRIVEGHGDLRPEHIYLTTRNGPTVIDCIEFNAEFRQLDVLDELSFLAMECELLDAAWVGTRILEHYTRTSSDEPPDDLRSFYICYRACVRAKVQALRASQVSSDERDVMLAGAEAYLQLADRYADKLAPPLLLVVRGLTGVGKSTLSESICDSLGIELLQTDAVRRELFEPADDSAADQSAGESAGYSEGAYCPDARQRVYDELFARAAQLLENRQSVVLDGTFLTTELRQRAAALAPRFGAAFLLIECHCPDEVAAERIAARRAAGGSLSQSRPEFVSRQRAEAERDPPGIAARRIDTSLSLPAMLERVFAALRRARPASSHTARTGPDPA